MSQDDSFQSMENQNKTSENISLANNYFNNIINNFNTNIDDISQEENQMINNITPNKDKVSNEHLYNNNKSTEKYQPSPCEYFLSLNSNDLKNIETFILQLYKELIKDTHINIKYYDEEFNKIKNIINNNNNNNNSFELIINIFKKSLIIIIEEKTREIIDNVNQFKSTILLLEQRNKFYIQQNFLKQTKIDILENEIDTYMEMEEEFDEMKEKLKYENGKFLHNEKKENEILILRAENSNLKKIIDKNEKTIEEKDHLIESIKKKSASMINTNNNTIKNSFDLNEIEHNQQPSSLIFIQNNQKPKFNHNNSNITNFKSYNIIQKMKSPNNNSYKTNNNSQSTKRIKFDNNKNNNHSKNKSNNMGSRASTKELINKKIKNKVLNMKKIRRINDSCLDNYNKSSAHITNSIMSNNSNNSSSKRLKKNINSFFKNNKNNIFNGISRIHKKIGSGLTNSNINNIIKKNNNKIIVNSILENNNNNLNNNNSFFFKTSRKKFGITKKNSKTNIKHPKEDCLLIRNNHSLIKSPTTFNNNDIENSVGMNNNIIINNIIQNSTSVPISAATSKSKEKINVSENEQNQNVKNNYNTNKYTHFYTKKDKNLKNKSSGFLSINIKKKNE